jgi:hypothetical protein
MKFLKVALVISLALGLTWAANQIVPSAGVVAVALAADTAVEKTSASDPVLEAPGQEEVDAQLERIDKALSNTEDLKDFVPSEPLSADVAIEFPSDI